MDEHNLENNKLLKALGRTVALLEENRSQGLVVVEAVDFLNGLG